MVLVVDHAAVGGGVDPAAVGIAHDDEIVGAHVAAAVLLVQERHREFQQIDLAVAVDVLEHRAGAHRLRRDRLMLLHALAIGPHHVERAGRHRQADRDREALRRIGRARDQPHALGIARHVLEQQRRGFRPRMVHDLAERAHLQVGIGALDAHDLAGFLGALDELAQVLVRRVVGVEALRLAFFQHGIVLRELFAGIVMCRPRSCNAPGCFNSARSAPWPAQSLPAKRRRRRARRAPASRLTPAPARA